MMLLMIFTLVKIGLTPLPGTVPGTVFLMADHEPSSSAEQAKQVDQAIQLYYDGRYEKALKLFKKALSSQRLTKIRTIGALQYLAYCEIALGDQQGAIRTFRRLLILKPEFRLPAGTAPKIYSLFKQVKASMPRHDTQPLARLAISHEAPKVGVAGKSLILRAKTNMMPKGGQLLVRYRYGTTGQYSRIQMEAGPHDTYMATIPPALGNKTNTLSYFICLIDSDDNKIGGAGSKERPFEVPLTPPQEKPKQAKSSGTSYHWWLWPVVGVVLVGTGLVVGLTLAKDNTPTGSAHVHFTLGD